MQAITLLFHDVVPEQRWDLSGFQSPDANSYKMGCDAFRQHLLAIAPIARLRVTAHDILRDRAAYAADRPILLSFDDGGESMIRYLADLLEEFGWKGHMFVTAGRIGTVGFLNELQIQELSRRGHIIGSHSYSHPTRMAHCTTTQLHDEWVRSLKVLGDILGEPVQTASVPGGYYSRNVAATAEAAGVKLLFNSEPTTRSHTVRECLVLGRFGAKQETPASWSAAIAAGQGKQLTREYLFWNGKKIAKTILGSAWLKARVILLARKR